MRQGKDDVEVTGRQDFILALGKPSFTRHVLASGTMAIAAGVIRNPQRAAAVATIDMAAEIGGAAV